MNALLLVLLAVIAAVGVERGLEVLVAGVIHRATPSSRHERRAIDAAHDAGAEVPRPVAYEPDLGRREPVALERVHGETIGRRTVR